MNQGVNIASLFYIDNRNVCTFKSKRVYGILNKEGTAVSCNVVKPESYNTLLTAKACAPYANGFTNYSWVNVYKTAEEALEVIRNG
jgi:hypothetical protein